MNSEISLFTGRPTDERSPKEERCYELLDSLGVEYMRADHEHGDTIEFCHQVEFILLLPALQLPLIPSRYSSDHTYHPNHSAAVA